MEYDKEELKEQVAAISWWLDPDNGQARKELEQRRPELGLWLDRVESMTKAKLAEHEAQEDAMKV